MILYNVIIYQCLNTNGGLSKPTLMLIARMGNYIPHKICDVIICPCLILSTYNLPPTSILDAKGLYRPASAIAPVQSDPQPYSSPSSVKTMVWESPHANCKPGNTITMMTSSNGNIFHVTGPLCGEFTGHR